MSKRRYEVDVDRAARPEAYLLRDRETRTEALLLPGFGNNCVSYRRAGIAEREDPVDLLVPPRSLDELRQGRPYISGNPILFPFPNRIRHGRYDFEGAAYQCEPNLPNGHFIHGLVADKPWAVEAVDASSEQGASVRCSIRPEAFEDVAPQFPFPCRLTVTYRLLDGILAMDVEVQNTGSRRLPFGFGIHPWLPAVFSSEGPRAASQVRVPCARYWELDEELIPTGDRRPVFGHLDLRQYYPLGDRQYDHVFTGVALRDGWSAASVRDPQVGIEILVEADQSFREWVLYAPARPVVCLEPYTCATDAVNLHARGIDAGLRVLEPGRLWSGQIRLRARTALPTSGLGRRSQGN